MYPTRLYGLVFTFVLSLPVYADEALDRINIITNNALEAHKKGEHNKAAELFADAWKMAEKHPNKPLKTKTAIGAINSLQTALTSSKQPVTEAQKLRLRTYHDAVIADGDVATREFVSNNLGTFYVQQKDFPSALTAFGKIEKPTLDVHVYEYNWGRAFERNEQEKEAVEHYWKALQAQPSMKLPAQRLFDLLAKTKEDRFEQATKLLDFLLQPPTGGRERNHAEQTIPRAGEYLYSLLERWGNDPKAKVLLPRLLAYVAQARLDPRHFETKIVVPLTKATQHSLVKEHLAELREVFFNTRWAEREVPLFSREKPILNELPKWHTVLSESPNSKQHLANIFKNTADYYYAWDAPDHPTKDPKEKGPPLKLHNTLAARMALVRYTAAFTVEPRTTEAVVYSVSALSQLMAATTNGTTRYATLLEELRKVIFDEKVGLYADYTMKTRAELEAILRCHVVLAGIAEMQGKWGPAGDSRSAIFQWTYARDNEKKLAALVSKGETLTPAWLEARLGNAYAKFEQPQNAIPRYLAAVSGFLADSNSTQANSTMTVLNDLVTKHPTALTPTTKQDLARFERLTANARRARVPNFLPSTEDGKLHAVDCVAFFPDSEQVFWFDQLSTTTWKLSGKPEKTTWLSDSFDLSLVFEPNRKDYALFMGDSVSIHGLKNGEIKADLGKLAAVAYSGDGNKLVGSANDKLTIWHGAQYKKLTSITTAGSSRALAISTKGDRIATGLGKNITLYDEELKKLLTFEGHTDTVTLLNFTPTTKWLASTGADRTVRVWDTATGKVTHTLPTQTGTVSVLTFSPDGKWLFTGNSNGTAIIWDLTGDTPRELVWLTPFRGAVTSASFAPNMQHIVIGRMLPGDKGDVTIWNLAELKK